MSTGDAGSSVEVTTSLPDTPLPPNSQRQQIRTRRLLLRPLRQDDLKAFHVLRTQPEAMTGTTLGKPDSNMEETQAALDFFLPPSDTEAYLFGIFLLSTGELIGEGGVHHVESTSSGWPEIGYKFKKEYWGQGFGSEFLGGFLTAWWSLPRCRVQTKVHALSVERDGDGIVQEQVYANTDVDNIASQRLLEKLGFRRFQQWTEPDTQVHRLGEPITLVGFRLGRPVHS